MTTPDKPPIMKYFETDHLTKPLAEISDRIKILAREMYHTLPSGPELSAGLRN